MSLEKVAESREPRGPLLVARRDSIAKGLKVPNLRTAAFLVELVSHEFDIWSPKVALAKVGLESVFARSS